MHARLRSIGRFLAFGSLLLVAGAVMSRAVGGATSLQTPSAADAMKEYNDTVRRGDAFYEAGNYFEAVLSFERAQRVAYNNKLQTDKAALEQRLARARSARDGKSPAVPGARDTKSTGSADSIATASPRVAGGFTELTTLLGTGLRTIAGQDVPQDSDQHYGPHGRDSRWSVSNPYLPLDRHFLPYIWSMACTNDGTVYLGGESVVPAAEARRQPRSNGDWYADNGAGIWKVAPDGQVTAFGVRPYGNQPGWDSQTAKCDVNVQQAGIAVEHWGGMVADSRGSVVFSDRELNVIMRMRPDGFVEHIAGGGARACVYDRYKPPQRAGFLDGPGKQALFDGPRGLALDRQGNILVADEGNCALRKIDPAGNVTTVNKGSCRFEGERMQYEYVVVDRDDLPIVGGANIRMGVEIYSGVYRFHPDGRIEQLLAGRRIAPRTRQQYVGRLSGLALLPNGSLIISDGFEDQTGNRLLEVRAGGVTRFLGLPTSDPAMPEVDGPADRARVFAPASMCSSGDGVLFVLPRHSRRPVRKFDPQTKTITSWVY
jgi:NHL repeat-containing protein